MKRFINASLPAYMAPEGTSKGGSNPIWGYHPDYNVMVESISKSRPVSEIMGYYEMQTHLLGPFPGELFNQQILTSKPHCTFLTFHKSKKANFYDANDTSTLLPEQLIGDINIIAVPFPKADITKADLEKADIHSGDIVIIKTGIAEKYREMYPTKSYYTDHPGITFEAAELLAEKGIKAVAIDVRDIEPQNSKNRGNVSVTEMLNEAGIIVIQDIANLDEVKESQKTVIISVPIKIRGMIGGPARVIAIDLDNPVDYTDLSYKLKTYPSSRYDRKHGWMEPLPERIDPRDMMFIMFNNRLQPFILKGDDVRTPTGTCQEMYITASHATNTHVEAAYFDPCHVHNIPEEILCRFKEMPLDRLIAPASVIDLSEKIGPRQIIDAPLLESTGKHVRKGDILFMRSDINDWYLWGAGMDVTAGFTLSAANWMIEKGIRCLAIDWASVERSNPASGLKEIHYTANDVHYTLHNADIPVVENLTRVGKVQKKHVSAAILPVPAHNLGGFPCDVFIWEDWD